MRLIQLFVPLDQLPSAFLNQVQAEQQGQIAANQNNGLAPGAGVDWRVWQTTPGADLADNTEVLIDDSINWRDRLMQVEYMRFPAGGADMPGGASDYNFPTAFVQLTILEGMSASGAYTAAGGAVSSPGNPPTFGPVPGPLTSYAILLEAPGPNTGVWLYCKGGDATGKLYLYNDLGGGAAAAIHLRFGGSGTLGLHP